MILNRVRETAAPANAEQPMRPNFALRRLTDRVRSDDLEFMVVRKQFVSVKRNLTTAFPGSRIVRIGSYSRGTAIAFHTNVDILAVLPHEWTAWGRDIR